MFARMFRVQATPEQVEEGLRGLRERTADVRSLAGFRRGYVLVDRRGGELVTVTLWASEAALNAGLPRARDILAGAVRALGGAAGEPQQYEVAVEF